MVLCFSLLSIPSPEHTQESSTAQVFSSFPSPAPSVNVPFSDGQEPPKKKTKNTKGNEMDDQIVRSLKYLQKRRPETFDEAGHFGQQVAGTLCRFTPRQMALAKLQIDQVLLNIEFPPESS